MSENTHYDEAAKASGYYASRSLHSDADIIALGQIEATLALAYEQRTANLIALESLLQKSGADIEVYAIQERLGLS